MNPDMVPLDEDEDEDSAPLYDAKRGAMPSVRMKGGGVVGELKFADELPLDDAGSGEAGVEAGVGDGGSVAAPPPVLAPMRSRADTLKLPLTSEGTVARYRGVGSLVCCLHYRIVLWPWVAKNAPERHLCMYHLVIRRVVHLFGTPFSVIPGAATLYVVLPLQRLAPFNTHSLSL